MSGHTPGPWYSEPQGYVSASFYIRGSDGKGNRMTWGKGAVAHIPRSRVLPMEANARLIAAAPDLLGQHEADITDLELLAKAIHAGDPMPELVIRVTDMLNRKRAAIRKATE